MPDESSGRRLSVTDRLRARYNIAAGYANKATQERTNGKAADPSVWVQAEFQARVLTAEIIGQRAEHCRHSHDHDSLCEFLRNLRAPAVVLLAGILAGAEKVGDLPPPEPLNLAPRAAPLAEDEVLLKLISAHGRPHTELIESLGSHPELESSRLAYNLACYYAVCVQIDDAFHKLAVALSDPALRAWAPNDPVLKPLHKDDRWATFFPAPATKADEASLVADLALVAVAVTFGAPATQDNAVRMQGSTSPGSVFQADVTLEAVRDPAQIIVRIVASTSDDIRKLHAVRLAVGEVDVLTTLSVLTSNSKFATIGIASTEDFDWSAIAVRLLIAT